jgi:hypothetical protein
MDRGTGLNSHAVVDGIEAAYKHGFIREFVDDHDQARIVKTYRLTLPSDFDSQVCENHTADVCNSHSGVVEITQRTSDGTLDGNLDNIPPSGESTTTAASPENEKTPPVQPSQEMSDPIQKTPAIASDSVVKEESRDREGSAMFRAFRAGIFGKSDRKATAKTAQQIDTLIARQAELLGKPINDIVNDNAQAQRVFNCLKKHLEVRHLPNGNACPRPRDPDKWESWWLEWTNDYEGKTTNLAPDLAALRKPDAPPPEIKSRTIEEIRALFAPSQKVVVQKWGEAPQEIDEDELEPPSLTHEQELEEGELNF